MAKGGHARSGPPPDPNALRRSRDAGEWTSLPADGRRGDPPEWPLEASNDREWELWERLWRMPQAVMWERQRQEVEVALYVRRLAEAEIPGSQVTLSTLVRQMGDSLGLSTPGLRSNRWRIVDQTNKAAEPAADSPPATPRKSSRQRLTVLRGDGAE